MCKFGKKCEVEDCEYTHDHVQKPCRFWPKCRKAESCLFLHASKDETNLEVTNADKRVDGTGNHEKQIFTQQRYDLSSPGAYHQHHVNNNKINNFQGFPTNVYPFHGDRYTRAVDRVNAGNGLPDYANSVRRQVNDVCSGGMQHAEFLERTRGCVPFNPQCSGQILPDSGGHLFHYPNAVNWVPNPGQHMVNQINNIDNNKQNVSVKVKLCRFGKSCEKIGSGCEFGHETIQKLCRSGMECSRKSTCLFMHKSASEGDVVANGLGMDSKNIVSRS